MQAEQHNRIFELEQKVEKLEKTIQAIKDILYQAEYSGREIIDIQTWRLDEN